MTASITGLHLQNYGCIKDLKLEGLGRLHAFIGPNDSGKSTILRGIRTLCHAMFHQWIVGPEGQVRPFASLLVAPYSLRLEGGEFQLNLSCLPEGKGISICRWSGGSYRTDSWDVQTLSKQAAQVPRAQRGPFDVEPLLLRLDADQLKAPSYLITEDQGIHFGNDRGGGLAGVYDAIRNRGDDSFSKVAQDVRRLFPSVRYVGLRNSSNATKELQLELVNGTKVPASALSEGLLLYLAFAALPYLGQPPVILVEEPENGLHPARIKDVVAVLREVSKTSQVFMATHSPLVVNELEPEEVFVTTRSIDRGTTVTRLDQTPNFEKRSSVYENGELWIAYADGDQESALLEAGE